jgi:enoyl-CoA hydratase/carnithine racemase
MTFDLTTTRHGHVTELVFAYPPHNHATVGLLRALGDTLHLLDADVDCRAVVLRSEGKAFCAGADLATDGGIGGVGGDPIREFYDQALRIYAAQKPIVAAVQGAAIGAGLGLAVAADFRVASQEARFSANFVRLGYHPGFGLTYMLPRLVGAQRAALMLMTARRFKPADVQGWGLVDQLVEAADLRDAALDLATEIAENAPLSLLATRRTLRRDLLADVTAALVREHAAQGQLRGTLDYAEGVKSVFERRPANFVGR